MRVLIFLWCKSDISLRHSVGADQELHCYKLGKFWYQIIKLVLDTGMIFSFVYWPVLYVVGWGIERRWGCRTLWVVGDWCSLMAGDGGLWVGGAVWWMRFEVVCGWCCVMDEVGGWLWLGFGVVWLMLCSLENPTLRKSKRATWVFFSIIFYTLRYFLVYIWCCGCFVQQLYGCYQVIWTWMSYHIRRRLGFLSLWVRGCR